MFSLKKSRNWLPAWLEHRSVQFKCQFRIFPNQAENPRKNYKISLDALLSKNRPEKYEELGRRTRFDNKAKYMSHAFHVTLGPQLCI